MVRPSGTATAIAMNVVKKVPASKGKIPKCLSANNGVHWVSVRKSIIETSEKKPNVSETRTQMIPMVVKIVIKAEVANPPSISRLPSFKFLFN